MICISIAEESRRLALADMLNAARQCDLLEVRLDRFGKAPDVGELLAVKPKPVIMSCRRPRDGGLWDGTEDERLALLRQCIISKADYVEIELDVADQVRKFPPAKRVIAYTNRNETPANIADIYAQAQTKSPDVIKLTTLARTPEEAWPLMQLLARAPVPTVVVGLGKPGVLLSVLGAKIGAPWTYAALERGMEAYPDQPTVRDLENVYHYRAINRGTRFIGVTGFGERERATVAALNAAFAHLQLPARCLPLGVGNVRLFGKVIEAVKLAGAVIDAEHRRSILQIAAEHEPSAARTGEADLILHRGNKWHAADTQVPATVHALEVAMKTRSGTEHPLAGRMVLLAGVNDWTRMMARELAQHGSVLIIASHDRDVAKHLAQEMKCRFVVFEALYTTMHDVLIVCDEEKQGSIHPGYLRPGMTVLDLTSPLQKSPLLREAETRGCAVVTPQQLWLEQVALQVHLLTSKDVPRQLLADAASWLMDEG
ncbi:MAG TPA: type I 3-dehydroquinate dehydratase [Gemmataceae bacterium]|jgi:3-dehydroquinate dehydratase/shikimate dehydrogenase